MGRFSPSVNINTVSSGGSSGSNDTDINDGVMPSEIIAPIEKLFKKVGICGYR